MCCGHTRNTTVSNVEVESLHFSSSSLSVASLSEISSVAIATLIAPVDDSNTCTGRRDVSATGQEHGPVRLGSGLHVVCSIVLVSRGGVLARLS